MQSEINKNIQGTNNEGKETGIQINDLDQKEEINIRPNRMKKQEFKKMRSALGNPRMTFNIPTSELWWCQKERRKSKKLKTYLNK